MSSLSNTSLGNRRHLDRFILHKGGKTIEEIAAEEGVRTETIRNSIRRVEIAQGYHTNEYMTQALIELILNSQPAAQKAILAGLTAQKIREEKNQKGETLYIKEPDHETQLKTLHEFTEIAKAAQPKPSHQTKIAVGVGVGVAASASGSYVGMEERMRQIRQKRKEQPVLEAATVTAAVLEADTEGDGGDE